MLSACEEMRNHESMLPADVHERAVLAGACEKVQLLQRSHNIMAQACEISSVETALAPAQAALARCRDFALTCHS